MGKTLTGIPVIGGSTIPARIELGDTSFTIKNGMLGESKTISYNSVQNVEYGGALSTKITIYTSNGLTTEVSGFSKSAFNELNNAINGGGSGKGGSDEWPGGGLSGLYDFKDAMNKLEEEEKEKRARIQEEIDELKSTDVAMTDENEIVTLLNKFVTTCESMGYEDAYEEEFELRRTAYSKFRAQFQILKVNFPDSKFIPVFEEKEKEIKQNIHDESAECNLFDEDDIRFTPTDEGGLVKNLFALISLYELKLEGKTKARAKVMKNYRMSLDALRQNFPQNNNIAYFTEKMSNWSAQAEIDAVAAKKKRKRTLIIIAIIIIISTLIKYL